MLSRKIIAALILTCAAGIVRAQDTNVLIGLNEPIYGIKIKNNFPGETRGFARAFMLSNQDATVNYIGLGAYGSAVNGVSSLTYGYIGPSYDKPFMTFMPNNNVGIGTTTPNSPLDVQGVSGTSTVNIKSIGGLATESSGIHFQNGRSYIGYDGTFGALRIATSDISKPIVFGNSLTAGTGEIMRLTGSGSLGIGTNSPSAKLHVNSSLTETAIKIGSPNVSGNINVPVGASTGGYNLDFYTWRDIQVDQIGARIRAERINSYQPNNALVQSMDLVFSTSTGGIQTELTEKLRINSTGNVSIGTSDAKGYRLAVNGNILATEIKVQAAPWPDYVFSKNYNLPALQSIEKHIKKEGYLPDMPSAKEVESNGINVGEMNAKLLKKIEELTLYIIDQNKELLNQKDQLNNLKKDNLELKKAVFGRKH